MNDARLRAMARRRYPDAPHFQGAFLRGARAGLAGVAVCPYRETGWGRAYRAAWYRGLRAVHGAALRSKKKGR